MSHLPSIEASGAQITWPGKVTVKPESNVIRATSGFLLFGGDQPTTFDGLPPLSAPTMPVLGPQMGEQSSKSIVGVCARDEPIYPGCLELPNAPT